MQLSKIFLNITLSLATCSTTFALPSWQDLAKTSIGYATYYTLLYEVHNQCSSDAKADSTLPVQRCNDAFNSWALAAPILHVSLKLATHYIEKRRTSTAK